MTSQVRGGGDGGGGVRGGEGRPGRVGERLRRRGDRHGGR